MLFKQITFQSAQLGPAVLRLFTNDDAAAEVSEEDISSRPERALVHWLMEETSARELLFEELKRAPDAFFGTEIQQPFYGASEGDIDLLVCNRAAPHEVAALECKRVKIHAYDEGNDLVHGVDQLAEGVRQAKRLYSKFGFFQTYFVVISAMDAGNQRNINIPNRGVTPGAASNWDPNETTYRRLRNFPGRDDLPQEIGIIFIEVVRPSSKSFEEQWTIRICLDREAGLRSQTPAVTSKVGELMRTSLPRKRE